MNTQPKLDQKKLTDIAADIRRLALKMIAKAGSGHPGGSLSIADILACLYFHEMNFSKKKLNDPLRDRLILSKGHAAPALYAVLKILEIVNEHDVNTLRSFDGILEGHVSKSLTPGVEMSSGSLGQGLSVAVGLSLAGKLDKAPYRVYAILGDGECQEGMIWEAVMAGSHYKLDNLCIFVDANGLQIDGPVREVMNVYPLKEKFLSFGWHTLMIDGHDISQISEALGEAKKIKDQPTAIIAKTVKGKGVSFMQDNYKWHGVAPNEQEPELALKELS